MTRSDGLKIRGSPQNDGGGDKGRHAMQQPLESVEFFEALIENSWDAITILNADGTLRYESPSMIRITGYEPGSKIGKTSFELIHPDDLPNATDCFAQLLQNPGGNVQLDVRVMHKDGSWRTIEVIGRNLLDDPVIAGIVVNQRDITEHKKAEQALRDSADKYHALFNEARDGIALIDIETGQICDCNPELERQTGRKIEQLQNMKIWEIRPPEKMEVAKKKFLEIQRTGSGESSELEFQKPDGEIVFVEFKTQLVRIQEKRYLQSIVRDQTERKQSEETLQRSEEYYRSLLENAMEGVAVLNRDGTLRSASSSAEHMMGRDSQEQMGTSVFENIHPDDMPNIASNFEKLLREAGGTAKMEIRILHDDGTYHTLEAIAKNLLDDPVVDGIVANFRDITERKQSEQALLIKDNAIEKSLTAIAITDIQGTVTYVNQACLGLWRIAKREDVVGQSFWALLQLDADNANTVAQSMIEHGQWQGELKFSRRDGEQIDVQVLSTMLYDTHGKAIQTITSFVDVTERKQIEERLRESEELFRALIENASDAFAILNSDGTIRYESPSIERVLGYSPEELIGKTVLDYVHPEDVPNVINTFTSTLAGNNKQVVSLEVRFLHKDGSWRMVEGTGRNLLDTPEVNGIVVNYRDITERKRAEEALLESEEQYSAVVRNVADAVFRFKDGQITWANDRIEDMLGYSKGEMVGLDASFFLSGDVKLSEVYKEVGPALERQGFFHGRTRAKKKDGSIAEIEYSASLIPGREPMELVGVARDVTSRSQIERQLQLAGRLAAVGELAAGVAHELNNPLAAVQAFAQYLTDREDLDESVRSDVETIFKESQRASRITGNLLSFARKHTPEKNMISINQVIERCLEFNTYRLKTSNIEVVLELCPELPQTMADFHQLEQVFINIINNAEQAMTEANGGGTLIIITEAVDEIIKVTFTDSGPGIPNEDLKSIFDPFFTTKGVGKGTGLGLSISYGILQEHGGRLYTEARQGYGATFVVELPIVSDCLAEKEAEPA
jgi:PAS domain S-box-containing protein